MLSVSHLHYSRLICISTVLLVVNNVHLNIYNTQQGCSVPSERTEQWKAHVTDNISLYAWQHTGRLGGEKKRDLTRWIIFYKAYGNNPPYCVAPLPRAPQSNLMQDWWWWLSLLSPYLTLFLVLSPTLRVPFFLSILDPLPACSVKLGLAVRAWRVTGYNRVLQGTWPQ